MTDLDGKYCYMDFVEGSAIQKGTMVREGHWYSE